MILAHLEARKSPLYLEHWEDMQIKKALYTKEGKLIIHYAITGENPLLVCRLKNGAKMKSSTLAAEEKKNKLFFRPEIKEDQIEITFQ